MPDLRTRRGELQAAVHTYQHTRTGRYFVLVGVAHIAEPGFWASVNARASSFQTNMLGEVHFECVANDTGLKHNRIEEHPYEILADLLGLQMQFPALDTGKGWINTDMTTTGVIACARFPGQAWEWLEHSSRLTLPKMSEKRRAEVRRIARFLMRYGLPLVPYLPRLRKRWLYRLIQDGRTDYAMRQMLARETHILTVWGSAHLRRMRRILRRNGYTRVWTEWETVIAK